jgi:hypothetical protein
MTATQQPVTTTKDGSTTSTGQDMSTGVMGPQQPLNLPKGVSMPPMGQDMSMSMMEPQEALALVPSSAVTDTVVQSGSWSQPSTWQGGHVPGPNANVLIPTGLTVTLDTVSQVPLHTVRVDGTLEADPDQDTGLMLDTMVVSASGSLILGTSQTPIAANHRASITFTDSAPIDTTWDPNLLSRGLISMGTVSMVGATTTPYVTLASGAHAGDTTLTLSQTPTNWQVGDELILPSTTLFANQDEDLRIVRMVGNQVTVSLPLRFDHAAPAAGLSVYITDVTRNVVLQSQNPSDTGGRGHVMFLSSQVNIAYAGFYSLGRTNKLIPINDPQLDSNGHLVAGTGTNPRGRYPIHFHHTGVDASMPPAMVTGSVVLDSPGWGYVNHDSYVDFEDNVAYNVAGAGFVTESGDEIGAFRGNLAIRSTGSGEAIDSRIANQDFGHEGDGFWLQGSGVVVDNNIAIGQAHAGFVFYNEGLVVPGVGTTLFSTANLPNPSLANGQTLIDVGAVALRSFHNNLVYASTEGLHVRYSNPLAGTSSVIDGLTVWAAESGAEMLYSHDFSVQNSWFFSDGVKGGGTAIFEGNEGVTNTTYQNDRVEGWIVGLHVSEQGTHVIDGGYYNNSRSIDIPMAFSPGRNVTIQGDIQFGSQSPSSNTTQQQYDIYLSADFNTAISRDFSMLFAPGTILYQGQQVYFDEQAADFVPFPSQSTSGPLIPPQLIGKTNQELWTTYGLAIGGAVAPSGTTTSPRIQGILGTPASYSPAYTLTSARFTKQLTGYQLQYQPVGASKSSSTGSGSSVVNLQQGWNLVTQQINGQLQTFFVFGDTTPPTFVPDPTVPLTIQASALSNGLTVSGQVVDNSCLAGLPGAKISQTFTGLDQLPLLQRPDGSNYVVVSFSISDIAGNTTQVSLDITVLPNPVITSLTSISSAK